MKLKIAVLAPMPRASVANATAVAIGVARSDRNASYALSLGGGVLLTLSGAAGFFGWIAAALLIACVAVLLVRRQIAARERYFAAGASTSGA
jgi:hypothetical protein